MFGRDWAASPRRFRVVVDRAVRIPLPDGAAVPAAKIARQKAGPS